MTANAEAIRRQLERFLDFSGPNAARMINNAEWLVDLRAVEFMRDVGKHFTVNYMLQKDSVKARMEGGISYTEFSYMLLQAYDFLELRRRHDVRLQMGGSDQWGNITAGIELIRRTTGMDAHAITSPLVTTSAGTKFGKTEAGAVWLDADADVAVQVLSIPGERRRSRRGKLPAVLHAARSDEIEDARRSAPPSIREQREAQRALAREVTRIVHGDALLAAARKRRRLLFGGSRSDGAVARSVRGAASARFRAFDDSSRRTSSTTHDVIELLIGLEALFKSKKAPSAHDSAGRRLPQPEARLARAGGARGRRPVHGAFVLARKGRRATR